MLSKQGEGRTLVDTLLVTLCTGLILAACARNEIWRGIGVVISIVSITATAATFVVSVVIGSIG